MEKVIGAIVCALVGMMRERIHLVRDIVNRLNGKDGALWYQAFADLLRNGLAKKVPPMMLKFKMDKQTIVLGPFPLMGGLVGDDTVPARIEEELESLVAGLGVIELETADPLSEDERKFSNTISCSSFWFVINGNDSLLAHLYTYPDGRMWVQVVRSELSAFYGPEMWYSNTAV